MKILTPPISLVCRLYAVIVSDTLTPSEKANLDLAKTTINSKITTVTARQRAIDVQKMTNANSISAAESSLTNAKSALANAQNGLNVGKAGAAPEEILAQEAQVQAAVASVRDVQAMIAKTVIRAPLDGTISKFDAKLGQIASPNVPVISMMSSGRFEIETHISETDIAKVKVGDKANITIDAYGNDVIFEAAVTNVDPAETAVNGVTTYKVTLQFTKDDDRIKSGMTANVKIITAEKQNVVAVPERTIITRGTDKFVLLDNGTSSPEERKVLVGIKGANGYWEIISGLNDGDKLLNFGNNQ
jgi:HlyD family secretion protein